MANPQSALFSSVLPVIVAPIVAAGPLIVIPLIAPRTVFPSISKSGVEIPL